MWIVEKRPSVLVEPLEVVPSCPHAPTGVGQRPGELWVTGWVAHVRVHWTPTGVATGSGTGLQAGHELGDLVVDGPALGHQLGDLGDRVHDGGVVAVA